MPRKAREKAECSIYHISVRGNNKQSIFVDDDDRIEYLARLRRYKESYKVCIYAYCLMTNHVHLLIFDNGQDISRFMQGLNLSYAIYFNKKYKCSGHLFQDRYTSSIVKNEAYFVNVSKYIHLNPVKAQLVQKPEEYEWSSYSVYIADKKDDIVDVELLLSYFAPQYTQSKVLYKHYVEEKELVDEEVASAEEEKINDICLRGMIKLEHEELINRLSGHWKTSVGEIMCNRTQGFRKEMLIYFIALIERLSYKKIGQLLNMSDVYISMSIKKIVEAMINDKMIMIERDAIIASLQK
ncbi:transposase [Cellulosilyticum lentocellum]|uniref:Transposase IS200-family protein n=1 Tax=Cellulosilyticum lentocellum (strain ATCC 49066 / DSM 5427 / NCIMB 11756 / RHM5) TaxID=642492 RepID=F2JIP1_CELLD|nr:transposase [Cellulosilyticum lentocellum]ADZ85511.1 transposase IS200-family protein [Cellulosilyticum lentocellum DSM 5427]